MDKVEYVSLKQIIDSGCYPFTMGQLRHYLMHRHKNGLEKAVRKIGKRLFLRVDLFNDWIDQQTGERRVG